MPYPPIKLTRKWRLTIMITLIALFFITSPLIIFYTAGYSYNWQTGQIQKTGVISIKAQPESADVFLNGVKLEKDLPVRLTNRAPGNYNLKIKNKGYHTWKKDIEVKSKKTTYINNIKLIERNLPIKLDLGLDFSKIEKIKLSPQHPLAVAVLDKKDFFEIKLIDLDTKNITELARVKKSTTSPKIVWHDKQPFGYIKNHKNKKTTYRLFNDDKQAIGNTVDVISSEIDNIIQWEQTEPRAVYLKDGSKIKKLSFSQVNTVATSSQRVWYYDSDKNNLWHYLNSKNRLKLKGTDKFLPISDNIKKIYHLDEKILIALTEENLIVYSRDKNKIEDKSGIPTDNIKKIGPNWIAWSSNQFWRINQNGGVDLLNRTNRIIESIYRLEQIGARNNLLIKSLNQLYTFDPRYYTSHDLFENKNINEVGLNREKRVIYIWGEIGKKDGIFYREY